MNKCQLFIFLNNYCKQQIKFQRSKEKYVILSSCFIDIIINKMSQCDIQKVDKSAFALKAKKSMSFRWSLITDYMSK